MNSQEITKVGFESKQLDFRAHVLNQDTVSLLSKRPLPIFKTVVHSEPAIQETQEEELIVSASLTALGQDPTCLRPPRGSMW